MSNRAAEQQPRKRQVPLQSDLLGCFYVDFSSTTVVCLFVEYMCKYVEDIQFAKWKDGLATLLALFDSREVPSSCLDMYREPKASVCVSSSCNHCCLHWCSVSLDSRTQPQPQPHPPCQCSFQVMLTLIQGNEEGCYSRVARPVPRARLTTGLR